MLYFSSAAASKTLKGSEQMWRNEVDRCDIRPPPSPRLLTDHVPLRCYYSQDDPHTSTCLPYHVLFVASSGLQTDMRKSRKLFFKTHEQKFDNDKNNKKSDVQTNS